MTMCQAFKPGRCAGFVIADRHVIKAAPIIKRVIGMTESVAVAWLKRNGWTVCTASQSKGGDADSRDVDVLTKR